jgi:hypothetical protein
LLDDAREICTDATKDGWGYSEPLHSVVAGLCRAAVDGALRQAVITRAVHHGEDVAAALAALGECRETKKRIRHVTDLAGGVERLPRLDDGLGHAWGSGTRAPMVNCLPVSTSTRPSPQQPRHVLS